MNEDRKFKETQAKFLQSLPDILTRSPPEICVWQCCVQSPPMTVKTLVKLLSQEEKSKAERFHFQRDRDRYILGRGLLRVLLGHYLARDPQSLTFVYSARGKPLLKGETLQFNISHSGDLILYGVSRDRPIGVDIEQIRPLPDAVKLAERFFCKAEWEKIRDLPSFSTSRAFFTAWTRKEAFLKATGEGIAGLKDVEVSLLPEEPVQIYRIGGKVAVGWKLWPIDLESAYVGAVAVQGENDLRLEMRSL
ncbi:MULTISPECIES: 4'-phosphopantetheinyl transferase superfamily protein [Spirulina sp. CCY15215]|uniref:4'-phosphopantetheinyl transferase family protein n=1 Tax=Spirulina sp. CCY15215 TaxID=2767591 RepID=UPI00194EE1BA|nr:4'-phosphopantetheinyl transferase superfamily protein [Spirulina major]